MTQKFRNLLLLLGLFIVFMLAVSLPLIWLLYEFSPFYRVISQVSVIVVLGYLLFLLFNLQPKKSNVPGENLQNYPPQNATEEPTPQKRDSAQTVGLVVHEIRKPLSKLRLQLNKLSEEEDLAELPGEVDKLLQTVDQVEEVFEREQFQPRWLSVPRLFSELISDFESPARDNLIFQLDLEWVYCDPQQLRLALINLIRNSLQAYQRQDKEGLIKVVCRRMGPEVCWQVEDRAGGMDEELARLINGQKSVAHHGMGLGLTLVKKICRNHRGRMMVNSESGAGTEVTLTLPQVFGKNGAVK